MHANDVSDVRELSGLTGALKACLGAYMIVAAIGLWSGWLQIDLLQHVVDGGTITEAEAAANDSRQALIGGVYMLVFLVTGILFLRWSYLCSRNAHAFHGKEMRFTPGWAVGWYFIPVFTLWRPYQAMKEIFKASHPGHADDWKSARHPAILPLWWLLWLLASFVGQAVLRTALRGETIDDLLVSSWLTFIADALALPLGIVAIVLVSKLQAWQSEKITRMRSAAGPTPAATVRP